MQRGPRNSHPLDAVGRRGHSALDDQMQIALGEEAARLAADLQDVEEKQAILDECAEAHVGHRHPNLMHALSKGQLKGKGKPDPRMRDLRCQDEMLDYLSKGNE